MTTSPPERVLTVTATSADPHVVHIHLDGELDHGTADELLEFVRGQLDDHPELTDLHLKCDRLTFCDSMGLSALLTIRRRTRENGARLHIDDRTPALNRILAVTGLLRHLVDQP